MSHRTPLRIFLLTLGALVLGGLGAALLDPGHAEAAGPPPTPVVALGAGAATVGPVTVDLPVTLPVAEPVRVAVPVPPAVTATVASLPIIGEIAETPIHVGLPSVAQIPALPVVGELRVPDPATALPAAPLIIGHAGMTIAGSTFAIDAAELGDVRSFTHRVASIGQGIDVTLRPILAAATSSAPLLPSIPWTLGLAGLLGAFATAGADRPGGKRSGESPFLAVITAGRTAAARLVARLELSGPDAARPGFALLLARPG